jgi:hypothetical protein
MFSSWSIHSLVFEVRGCRGELLEYLLRVAPVDTPPPQHLHVDNHTMNTEFSVEVPGEANPLTEGILFNVLRSASSADQTQVQTGTKQLQQWEKAQGFYPLLQVGNVLSLLVEVRLKYNSPSFLTGLFRWKCATSPSSSSRTASTNTGARQPPSTLPILN